MSAERQRLYRERNPRYVDTNRVREQARAEAFRRLADKYVEEYKQFYREECAVRGVDPPSTIVDKS